MKVLLINGSPHQNGCTYTALCEAAKALNAEGIETEFFWLGTKPIAGCMGCRQCFSSGQCVFDDCVMSLSQRPQMQMVSSSVLRCISQVQAALLHLSWTEFFTQAAAKGYFTTSLPQQSAPQDVAAPLQLTTSLINILALPRCL